MIVPTLREKDPVILYLDMKYSPRPDYLIPASSRQGNAKCDYDTSPI